MKCEPILLPTPREPLCSMIQTASFSSRQISMKWLPLPSVPSCVRLFVLIRNGCFSQRRSKRPLNAAQAFSTSLGGSPQLPLSRAPCAVLCSPCGTRVSIRLRTASRESGNWSALRLVFAAIIPQPKSTPTAAGITAPIVGITLPIVAPFPKCTSGITAIHLWMNGIAAIFRNCCLELSSKLTPRVQDLIGCRPGSCRTS